jgi:hypothetical protein
MYNKHSAKTPQKLFLGDTWAKSSAKSKQCQSLGENIQK